MSTEKKVAVITGASSGIGAGILQAFRDRNYRVVATSRSMLRIRFRIQARLLGYLDVFDAAEPRNEIDPEACWACCFDVAERRLQHVGGIAAAPSIPIPPALHTARTRGAVAMNAMPALMNGTFSLYWSVMRVFNMGLFPVEFGYRGSGPSRPMNFAPRPSVGSIPLRTSRVTICRHACRRPRAAPRRLCGGLPSDKSQHRRYPSLQRSRPSAKGSSGSLLG